MPSAQQERLDERSERVPSRRRATFGAFIPLLAAACASEPGHPESPYPLDEQLTLEHVQAKATHNSYHVATTKLLEAWSYTQRPLFDQLEDEGVRGVELDVHYMASTGSLEVFHIGDLDEGTTCRLFRSCLAELARWSAGHRGHMPISVQIEPKAGFDGPDAETAFTLVEQEIQEALGEERLVTPAQVQGDHPTLRDAIATDGWPTLATSRGKFLFYLNNNGAIREAYTHGGRDLLGRLLFVESSPGNPFASFAVLDDPTADADAIQNALGAHLLIRARADKAGVEAKAGDPSRRDLAFASGAQWVGTDFPEPAPRIDYFVDVPGGTPARCNPKKAPADCTPEAIENPRALRTSWIP